MGTVNRFEKQKRNKQEKKHIHEDIDDLKKQLSYQNNPSQAKHQLAYTAVTIMSIFTTFYMIWYPAQVVFDEVHFGKFAGYYLQRAYFFDVHPPLAKLMLAAVGYMIGFDGVYQFSNIGESYAQNQVPYIPLRALPAFLNVLSVGLVYKILKESGYAVLTCFMVSTLYLLDNGFIGQNRLILLDSILIFYMLTTIYSFVRFRKLRHMPFTRKWWLWMVCTGVCMSLTLSVKMVGLFVFLAIGVVVIKDLWELLDIKTYGLSHKKFAQYFGAHAIGLIIVPACVYLFWFYIHFSILIYSGPGDFFMSTQFQDTLKNSQLRLNSLDIMYNQSIRLQHKDTKAFLHGNGLHYPAQYEDGRYSSRGLQVTGNMQPDIGSYWRIKPGYSEATETNVPVKHNDVIRLEHIGSGLDLLTHDVASPWMPTNMEFTLNVQPERYNETLFRVVLDTHSDSEVWSTLLKSVRLVNVKTNVALWCNSRQLPDWGLNQLEVNGNKKSGEAINFWTATDILGLNATDINLKKKESHKVMKMGFFAKFYELQTKMLVHNSRLTASHPYQSTPFSWPLMLRGISYWTQDDINSQIYLTGNVAGWWTGLLCVFLFSGISVIDMALQRRQIFLIKDTVRNRLNRSGGFFLLLWAAHYLPFYLMGRCLYLHHYLPAMACNYLLIGSVFEFLFIHGVNSPVSYQPNGNKYSISLSRTTFKGYVAAFIMISMQFTVYVFLSPMTYGTPGLTAEEATRRKIMDSWDVRFAKFMSDM